MKGSPLSAGIACSAIIATLSACQSPSVNSIADSPRVPLPDGYCVNYMSGLFYGDFFHNAPREVVWGRASAVVRPQTGAMGASADIEVVESCPPEGEVTVDVGQESAHIRSETDEFGNWITSRFGSTRDIEIVAPHGSTFRYVIKEPGINFLQLPIVAPEAKVAYAISSGVDVDRVVLIDLNSHSAYRLDLPIATVMGSKVGEHIRQIATPISVEVTELGAAPTNER